MRGLLAGLVRRTEPDRGPAADQGRLVARLQRGLDRGLDLDGVMPVDAAHHVPAVGLEALRGVVGEPAVGVAVDADVVVVPERHQLVQAPGAGQRRGLVRDAFHQAAVAQEHPGMVVDDLELRAVEALRQQLLRQRHAHGIGQALAQRAGGGFDTGRVAELRVAGGLAVQLPEALELLDRQVVAAQVQQRVDQHRAVAVGQHETVAVEPLRVVRAVAQEVVPEHLGDVGHAHRHARVPGLCRLDGIHGQETDGVGEVAAGRRGHGRCRRRLPPGAGAVFSHPAVAVSRLRTGRVAARWPGSGGRAPVTRRRLGIGGGEPRQGERPRRVTRRFDGGNHRVPGGRVEPEAGEEEHVHAATLGGAADRG